jgi:uncharacterized protein (DUF1015 family)
MPQVKPFRAVVYNQKKSGNLENVLAPPYDVISPQKQEDFYSRSPYNIIRIILGKTMAKDTAHNNQYVRAGKFLEGWLSQGVLKKERSPAIYIYEQTHQGVKRLSIVALLRMEALGRSIFPHEETLLEHRVDRLNLLRVCRANFSPIFFLYSPSSRDINEVLRKSVKEEPTASIEFDGIGNRIWRISDKTSIGIFQREMKNRQVFIADGHHRYEVALKYAREAKGAGYVMGMFVSMEEKGLRVLPTHRLVKVGNGLNRPEFLEEAKRYFKITKFKSLKELFSKFPPRFYGFGIYFGNNTFYLLSVKDIKLVERRFQSDVPPSWRRLNMVILHHFFFHHILKLGEIPGENIKYITDENEAKKLVDSKIYNAAFFLNSIRPQVVRDIALSGEKMPHKATYFYPKPLSGLIINKF